METQNTDMIEYLLPRYCSGEATVKECRQVEEWIRLSDENYRIAKQIHTLYLATGIVESGYGESAIFCLSKDEQGQCPSTSEHAYFTATGCSNSVYSTFDRFRYTNTETTSAPNSSDD